MKPKIEVRRKPGDKRSAGGRGAEKAPRAGSRTGSPRKVSDARKSLALLRRSRERMLALLAKVEAQIFAVEKILDEHPLKPRLSAFFGTLKPDLDAVEYQNKLRDEWVD